MRCTLPASALALSTILLAAACPDSPGTSDTQATGSTASDTATTAGGSTATDTPTGTDTGGSGTHAICDRYLACIAIVAPGELPGAQMGFGSDGTCWQGNAMDAQLCLDACKSGLAMFNELFPDEPKCGLCQDHSECDMAGGELCHLGTCKVTTCGDGIVDAKDICDSQPNCDSDCLGPQPCNPISNFGCAGDDVCYLGPSGTPTAVRARCVNPDVVAQQDEPCSSNYCAAGLGCAAKSSITICDDPFGCCAKYCDLEMPNTCPEDRICIAYDSIAAFPVVPELGFVGLCLPP